MAKTLTSLLTLAALVIHAVPGCCAHHVHCTESSGTGCVHADSGRVHTHSTDTRMCASCPESGAESPCNASNSSDRQPDGTNKHQHIPCDNVPCEWLSSVSVVWSTHHACFSFLRAHDCGFTAVTKDSSQPLRIDAAQSDRPNIADACALTQVWLL